MLPAGQYRCLSESYSISVHRLFAVTVYRACGTSVGFHFCPSHIAYICLYYLKYVVEPKIKREI